MTEKKPPKQFSLVPYAKINIRDKDNTMPRIKPPQIARQPAPNLAPPGMVGIRSTPGTVAAKPVIEKPKKTFSLDRNGDLTREFKPLAAKAPDKDRGR